MGEARYGIRVDGQVRTRASRSAALADAAKPGWAALGAVAVELVGPAWRPIPVTPPAAAIPGLLRVDARPHTVKRGRH